MSKVSGAITKMRSVLDGSHVDYFLPIGSKEVEINSLIGSAITIRNTKEIRCIYCDEVTPKSYSQGYCFKHAKTLAACDLCIVRPETCHYSTGTCREPKWGLDNCFIPHVIYLAKSSDLKVGITKAYNTKTRWVDQGAVQGLAFLEVNTRHAAGIVETKISKLISDKTNWRKMLKLQQPDLDLKAKAEEFSTMILGNLSFIDESYTVKKIPLVEQVIEYPVNEYPEKIVSLNLEKNPEINSTLLGVKGQYLILTDGVLNLRKYTGYVLELESKLELVINNKLDATKILGADDKCDYILKDKALLPRTGIYGSW